MTKHLLNNYGDFIEMINREWLEGIRDFPYKYPCVVVVQYNLSPDVSQVEFVYLSDFKVA